jgi:hypothetical protein
MVAVCKNSGTPQGEFAALNNHERATGERQFFADGNSRARAGRSRPLTRSRRTPSQVSPSVTLGVGRLPARAILTPSLARMMPFQFTRFGGFMSHAREGRHQHLVATLLDGATGR